MQERKKKINWLYVVLLIGLLFFEIQVCKVNYETVIGLINAMIWGCVVYSCTAFALIIAPYTAITAMEEQDAKTAILLLVIILLLIIFFQLIFWGIITQKMNLIVFGLFVGFIFFIMTAFIFYFRR